MACPVHPTLSNCEEPLAELKHPNSVPVEIRVVRPERNHRRMQEEHRKRSKNPSSPPKLAVGMAGKRSSDVPHAVIDPNPDPMQQIQPESGSRSLQPASRSKGDPKNWTLRNSAPGAAEYVHMNSYQSYFCRLQISTWPQ